MTATIMNSFNFDIFHKNNLINLDEMAIFGTVIVHQTGNFFEFQGGNEAFQNAIQLVLIYLGVSSLTDLKL